jgi:hypothetical protein
VASLADDDDAAATERMVRLLLLPLSNVVALVRTFWRPAISLTADALAWPYQLFRVGDGAKVAMVFN